MIKNLKKSSHLFFKIILIGLIVLSFYDNNYASCDTLILNSNLAECYREENLKPLVPNTLQVLLEIIKKLENVTNSAGDIRLLSAKILHHIRLDGVQRDVNATESEFAIPYSTTGLMAQKYSILLKLISNVPGIFKFDEYLTKLEICTLHKILSSTVEPMIRGDEHLTCKDHQYVYPANRVVENSNSKSRFISYHISRCPFESGVIRTKDFGTISPGILIASIAAGLQPQAVQLREIFPNLERSSKKMHYFQNYDDYNVNSDENDDYRKQEAEKLLLSTMNDRINNTFASNLAGDLAEVCLFQSSYYGEIVNVGTSGYWNNFEYPISYYINDSNSLNWLMTDSEILAGIDGYYFANNIHSWVKKISLLRLSQVIELYYSRKGVPNFQIENSKRKFARNDYIGGNADSDTSELFYKSFNDHDIDSNGACKRKYILRNIERQKLKHETYLFAKILQYTVAIPIVEDKFLKEACDIAVDKFFQRANQLLLLIDDDHKCKRYSRVLIDMIIILDGSRNQLGNYELISNIGETIDVTSLTSSISVINGATGQYMIKSTQSIVDSFKQFAEFDKRHPIGLSLTKSLSTIIFSLENSTSVDNLKIVGLSPVIVVFSQSQKILDNDFVDAKRLIEGSFKYNQNIYFVFITNDKNQFEDLVADERNNSLNPKDKFKIIETENLDVNQVSTELLRNIRFIPKWLRALNCEYNEYEDYIGTEHSNYYRINSYEIKQHPEMLVQFQVAESYGIIIICKNIDNQPSECISSRNSLFGEVSFEINESCLNENNCPAINFKVELDTSYMKCTETTCRYPDEIRYTVRIKRSGCNNASSLNISHNYYIYLFIFFIYLFNN